MNKLFSILFFFLALSVAFPLTGNTHKPFVVVLDAGHGGYDPGTLGKRGKEKNVNLAVTRLLGQYIAEQHPDVKVIYTRKDDKFIGLNERANIANKSKADLFISIHVNSCNSPTVRGPEVYAFGLSRTKDNLKVAQRENSVIKLEANYEEKYEGFDPNSTESYIIFEFIQNKFLEQSLDFAGLVLDELKSCVQWRGRGVKQDVFAVLRNSSMPRILIELDFMSNPEAETFLLSKEGQQKHAKAICRAFTKYKNDYDRKNHDEKKAFSTIENRPEEIPAQQPKEIASPPQEPTKPASIYKVQILAGNSKLPAKSPEFKGYKVDYYVENHLYKYTYGESIHLNEISQIRKSILKDFKDAFIVRFENGVKVQTIY
ncbi:MAG: N-acetylmuramoyl-L-alanine amidase [Candidatus Symbiothrix sp.]|nr:N-acetylmuramoyl-L-alanine amidase [Candidatus Symbiothrix sp.]